MLLPHVASSMSTKDVFTALPDRPLTIAELNALERQDEIEHAAPLLGLTDDLDPSENVVAIYLGTNNRGNLVGYATLPDETWERTGVLEPDALSTGAAREEFQALTEWVADHTPGHSLAALQKERAPV